MRYLWDEPKRAKNLQTHGLDFADAERFDWSSALVVESHPGRRGERRWKAIGMLGEKLVVLVFAPLGTEAVSVISLRPASRKEGIFHEQG